MSRTFIAKYGIAVALIAAAICAGGVSLAQQIDPRAVRHTGPHRPHRIITKEVAAKAAVPVPTPAPVQIEPLPAPIVPAAAPAQQPQVIVMPAAPAAPAAPAQVTVTAPPAQVTVTAPKPGGGFLDIGQAFNDAAAPYINAAVNVLIMAFIGWLATIAQKLTGKTLDEKDRGALAVGLKNQAGSLIADGVVSFKDGKIAVDSAKLERASGDLLKSLPDAAKRFGITPEFVQQRIIDTIPQIDAGAQILLAHAKAAMFAAPGTSAAPPAPPAPPATTTGT
jgi:hypothetical protein